MPALGRSEEKSMGEERFFVFHYTLGLDDFSDLFKFLRSDLSFDESHSGYL